MSMEPRFKKLVQLRDAFDRYVIRPEQVTAHNCKNELFIYSTPYPDSDEDPELLYSQYFGSREALEQVCGALGITEIWEE